MIFSNSIDSFFKLSKIILGVNIPNHTAKVYTVKSEVTLSHIATKNGLTVKQLLTIPSNKKFKANILIRFIQGIK
ncbi:hypothetical protein MC5_04020 [Rickettsia australis str. Cutlack]|uniref:LysM domain-containing protein n=1 Tax=Rickettsia australis (strain Cutlack) TaxID=1105110 RepID=H8K778_RICAC|nr:hypothetical protein MC5_04020 [Rickettsia australis str. Cutlack]